MDIVNTLFLVVYFCVLWPRDSHIFHIHSLRLFFLQWHQEVRVTTLMENVHRFALTELGWSHVTVTLDTTLQMTANRVQVY